MVTAGGGGGGGTSALEVNALQATSKTIQLRRCMGPIGRDLQRRFVGQDMAARLLDGLRGLPDTGLRYIYMYMYMYCTL